MSSASKRSVLFVCWGNICRSPIAEALLRNLIKERGCSESWTVDSAATGDWNTGNPPDERAQHVMHKHGLSLDHSARIVCKEDFEMFDFILYMDEKNREDLELVTPADSKACVRLLSDYGLGGAAIIDPYYGKNDGFDAVFDQCSIACANFLDSVQS